MADRIISSRTHDAHMTVKDHIADGWVASVCVVPKGASKSNELIKLDTFFESEDVAWESAETLARAQQSEIAQGRTSVLAVHQPTRLDSHEGVTPIEPAIPETI